MKYRVYVDETKKRKDGMMPVALIFEDGGKRFKVTTGLFSTQKFKGREFPDSEPNFRAKTMALSKKLMAIDEHLIVTEREPMEQTKTFVREVLGKEEMGGKSLTKYLEEFGKTKPSEGTQRLYVKTAEKVRQFDAGVTLNKVTPDWVRRFDAWLAANGVKSLNGRAIHLRSVKALMNWAFDEGLTREMPFRKFKIKTEKVEIRNVTVDQLRALRDCKLPQDRRLYRDLFMLSFYLCGINPVDLLHLKAENVRDGRLVYKRQKTGALFNIPIVDEAMEIIERYRGKNYLLNVMDYEVDYLSFTSKWGKQIKVLGPAGIYQDALGRRRRRMGDKIMPNATVYSARYTFASIGAELEIPRETIALCLGHSWADVTSHFIAYTQKRIDDAVKKIVGFVNEDLTKKGDV